MSTDAVVNQEPWEQLKSLADADNTELLEEYVEQIGPSEAFRALLRMKPETREKVLTTLSPQDAAGLMQEIPDEHAADLIEELPPLEAASIVNEMESDDQADVLSSMEENNAEAILAEMKPEEAEDARRLLPYASDVAGGLMVSEVLTYTETALVGDVIEDLSIQAEQGLPQDIDAYVVSPGNKLIGVLDLRDLVVTHRQTMIGDILRSSLFVSVDTTLDELEDFFPTS